jgi:hypothetical protein
MMEMAKFDGAGVAGGKGIHLALMTAAPDRTDGMDHMPRRQPIGPGDLGITRVTSTEGATFRQQFRSGRAVNCTVDATSAKQ